MKKTTCIQLVLITAALASCNRYFNQPGPPENLPPDYYTWYYGFQPYGMYYDDPFYLEGYYYYRDHVRIVRYGFGRSGGSGHSGHS